ncbi:MAG: serine/threonine-protein kinase, partial [Planctomycetia bacterium]|nr:serine/threonine-protein kinase [Planctomycetia bacterium]
MDDENRVTELETVVFGNSNPPKSSMQLPENLLSVGDILCGIYILRMRLGRGGMGEIWKADEVYEGEILRTVVIKTLAPNVQNVEEELARIQSMFHKIHSLQHQHICPMYAMKNDPKAGTIIVMKFIDGVMLQEYYTQYMRLHTEFPVSEVTRLLHPIAQALDYSHSKKVLHRDVKPQNILVSKDESDGVQLIDFGLVLEMRSSLADNTSTHFDGSGTLPYMSPEQWSGDFQDAKADQFSLAVVVYELLAGKLPFAGNNIQILGFQILNKSPDPIPNVPDYVNFALQKALAKDRKQRFATCVEFIDALASPIITSSTVVRPQMKSQPVETPKQLSKMGIFMIAGSGALAALLLLALCLILLRSPGKMVANNPETSQNGASTEQSASFTDTKNGENRENAFTYPSATAHSESSPITETEKTQQAEVVEFVEGLEGVRKV